MFIKKIILQTIFLATILSISSCNLSRKKNNQNTIKLTSIKTKEHKESSTIADLSISDFKGIPEDIEGCSCYFSETDQKFKNGEYVFAANFDSIGFISINNKLIKLKLTSTGREPNTFGDNDHKDIYNSELYKVTLDIKYKSSNGEETWWNDGTITVESKEGQKVTKKFVGECGC